MIDRWNKHVYIVDGCGVYHLFACSKYVAHAPDLIVGGRDGKNTPTGTTKRAFDTNRIGDEPQNAILPEQTDSRPRPFYNRGRSCYVNALAQGLYACLELLKRIVSSVADRRYEVPPGTNGDVLLAATWISSLEGNRTRRVQPNVLLTETLYTAGESGDPIEFLLQITDSPNYKAPCVNRAMSGVNQPMLRCAVCHAAREAEGRECFRSLALPLVYDGLPVRSVQEAITKWEEPSRLPDATRFHCQAGCGDTSPPFLVHNVVQWPEVLCLQLKR